MRETKKQILRFQASPFATKVFLKKGQDVAFEGEAGKILRQGAVLGHHAQGREQDAPPVVSGPLSQHDAKGIVDPGGEEDALVGPVRKGGLPQQELGPVGSVAGGERLLAEGKQLRPVLQDEGAGTFVAFTAFKQGQQGVPDLELDGLILLIF